MKTIVVGNESIGKIKELHGVNCAPYSKNLGAKQARTQKIFEYAGVPRSRLHDCCGSYGGAYFVDVPNIFRDFDADENDPNSYDFYYTDEYIGAIIRTGAQLVYRLGITIEWGSKKYRAHPPKDYAKWARICEHIVRHYNEGWNNGFHYGIEYWEIWNEPENPPMWTGTMEQFFELYKVSSLHLRKCFPYIKIGGYGSCGFYALFRPEGHAQCTPFYKGFLVWFDEFLKFVKQHGCPLDFYTWHIYTPQPKEIEICAKHVRAKLNEYGFTSTESHLNEWNYGAEGGGYDNMATMKGASFCAAALCLMQNNAVDKAQYYVLSYPAGYNGWLTARCGKYTPTIHSFAAFSKLYKAGNSLAVTADEDAPWCIAAKSGDGVEYAYISTYEKDSETLKVTLSSAKRTRVYALTAEKEGVFEHLSEKGFVQVSEAEGNTAEFETKPDCVYVVVGDGELGLG